MIHRIVEKEMTWEPLPDGDGVILRFVENPAFFEIVRNRAVLERLKAVGQPVIRVQFDVAGRGMMYSYRLLNIAGQPFPVGLDEHDRSGYDGSGPDRHPLDVFTRYP
jgi:hypothetical protein